MLTYDILVKEIPDQVVLAAHRRVSLARVAEGMREAFEAIMGQVAATGVVPSAPPFCLYPEMPGDDFEIIVCMPIGEPGSMPAAESGVRLEQIPGGLVAATFHHGSYERLCDAYDSLARWMADNGRHPAGPPREIYLNEPGLTDPEELLTEVDQPIA